VRQNPVLSTVKLVAEPRDLGLAGYQVGSVPRVCARPVGTRRLGNLYCPERRREIPFKLPKMNEYKSWQQILNTTDANLNPVELLPGAETKAPPRSVLAFAGAA
jgi:hypothetical protein